MSEFLSMFEYAATCLLLRGTRLSLMKMRYYSRRPSSLCIYYPNFRKKVGKSCGSMFVVAFLCEPYFLLLDLLIV